MSENSKLKGAKCRTCFSASKVLKSLAKLPNEKHHKISYGEMLKQVTCINIMDKKFKAMPQFICSCCCRKLQTAHEFVQQVRMVDKKLRSMLSEPNDSKNQDCLQETQIDLDIKQGNFGSEKPLEDQLHSKHQIKFEDEIMLSNYIDIETTEELKSLKYVYDTNNLISEQKYEENEVCILTNYINKSNQAVELKPVEIITMESRPDNDNIAIFKSNIGMSNSDDVDDSLCSDTSYWPNNKDLISGNNSKDDPAEIAVPCEKCNKIFVTSKALAIHQRISHIPEEQKCACTVCGQKFTRYCNMYKHMRAFHGADSVTISRKPAESDNLYDCNKCSKKYAKKKSLNAHMRRKHTNPENSQKIYETTKSAEYNKKYSDKGSLCPICGSSFTSKTQLTIHIRRHTGERPFKCDICDRAFLLATHLTCHKRLHTGEKPFKCKVCTKAFRVSSDLAQHMRSHSDVRAYKCLHCERSFKYSQDLSIHKRSHTGERPYVCVVCGSEFQRYNTLRDHQQRTGHTDDIEQLENELLDKT